MAQKIFLENTYQKSFEARIVEIRDEAVQLDKTAFYATSGGQPGDTGFLKLANKNYSVLGAKKGEGLEDVWHMLEDTSGLSVEDLVVGEIDWDVRHKHMRMHTLLHLLCSLVEGEVTGCQIGADKSRVDFNMEADAANKEDLTTSLNKLISEDHPVFYEWITDEELLSNPSLVRSMSVKPPVGTGRVRLVRIGDKDKPIDLQPCGGTHVKSTGEIGIVEIVKIENKGKQNRRISVVFA